MAEEETQTEENTTDVEEPEDSLEQILNGEESFEEEQPEAEQEKEPAAEPAAEEEEEPAKGEEKPDAGEADLTDDEVAALPKAEQGQYKALKAERGKRQALEGTNTELLAGNQKLTDQVAQLLDLLKKPAPGEAKEEVTAEEVKSFWDDPEGYLAQALKGVSGDVAETRQEARNLRLNTSELLAKSRHEDYGEVYNLFAGAIANHPNKDEAKAMMESITTSPDPAEAAYQQGLKIKSNAEITEAGGLDALIAKRVADGIAAQADTAEAEEADELVQGAKLPTPMADRRASGGAAKAVTGFEEDQSMSEILGGR